MAQNGALGPAPASKHLQLAGSLAGAPAHLPGQREAHSSSEAGVGGRETGGHATIPGCGCGEGQACVLRGGGEGREEEGGRRGGREGSRTADTAGLVNVLAQLVGEAEMSIHALRDQ